MDFRHNWSQHMQLQAVGIAFAIYWTLQLSLTIPQQIIHNIFISQFTKFLSKIRYVIFNNRDGLEKIKVQTKVYPSIILGGKLSQPSPIEHGQI